MTKQPDKKFEGIITAEVLKSTNSKTPQLEREYQSFYEFLKSREPLLVEDVRVRGNEARDHFRRSGVSGRLLDELTDALKTFYIRGVMVYRDAISEFDAQKLREIYGQDYESYQDQLIEEGLRRKAEEKANQEDIESIEPEKEPPKDLDDLMG